MSFVLQLFGESSYSQSGPKILEGGGGGGGGEFGTVGSRTNSESGDSRFESTQPSFETQLCYEAPGDLAKLEISAVINIW